MRVPFYGTHGCGHTLSNISHMYIASSCITAYTECSRHNSDSGSPPSRKPIIAKFTTPVLDSARIGRILKEYQPHILVHDRETAGEPLLVFKYDRPSGRQWINTKKYADLSKQAMTVMCQADCILSDQMPSSLIS